MRKRKTERARPLARVNKRRSRQREDVQQPVQQQQRPFDEHQVLTVAEWCRLNHIGLRTGRRILAGQFGQPPTIVQLSPKRIGITYGANARWQASRERVA
jgi:hypothetical protein